MSTMTGGESSRRTSPRKRMLSLFQRQGIKINESYVKAQRTRGTKKPLFCPFVDCLRDFQETGNLKTHLRIHVRIFNFLIGLCDPFNRIDGRETLCMHL